MKCPMETCALLSACLALLLSPVHGFNLAVDEPAVYTGPGGSLFGFSVDFYLPDTQRVSVLVGAPKANTSQPDVVEGGTVYYCPWQRNDNSNCTRIPFDTKGNRYYDFLTKDLNITLEQVEYKSGQWFGATVRSHGNSILACAPRYSWRTIKEEVHRDVVGTCYLSSNNFTNIVEYSPCRTDTYGDAGQGFCQGGFAAEFTKSGRILLGGPGSYFWQGQVITATEDEIQKSYYPEYFILEIKGQMHTRQAHGSYDDSYLGYSVAVGEFSGDNTEDFVAGVPKGNMTFGYVTILNGTNLKSLYNFSGEQMASYFGYAVAATDLNNDGLDDLIISAPLFMERTHDGRIQEVGRVYIYLQDYNMSSTPSMVLTGQHEYGRFGSSIATLGDLDQDGFNDIAIGAPFDGKDSRGAVYIFNGNSAGLNPKPSQVLEGMWGSAPEPAFFGFSTRGGKDLDGNGYPDLIVGAFGVDKALVYRGRPIVHASASLSISSSMINPEEKTCMTVVDGKNMPVSCVNLSFCLNASGKHVPNTIGINVELQLDSMKQRGAVRRALFLKSNLPHLTQNILLRNGGQEQCSEMKIYLKNESEFRDKLSPIFVSLNFSLDSHAPPDAHGLLPIFNYKTKNHIEQKVQIQLDCDNNICVPDLKLNVSSDRKSVYLGDVNSLTLMFNAINEGEGGAYEAELYVVIPAEAEYSGVFRNEKLPPLSCRYEVQNETRLVICDLGNPMKSMTSLLGGLRFTVPHLRDSSRKVHFESQIRSKNANNSQSDLVQLAINVEAYTAVSFLGVSKPDSVIFPLANWKPSKNPTQVDEAGPEVNHVYELANLGPSSISYGTLTLICPRIHNHKELVMYVMNYSVEGLGNCTAKPSVNPLQLQYPTGQSSAKPGHHVERRDTSKVTASGSHVLKCHNPEDCFNLTCDVLPLEKLQRAILKIHLRVWGDTFMQKENQGFTLQCEAKYRIERLPYKIQPVTYPQGTYQVNTTIHWLKPESSYGVPLWIIILAILIGLLLLALLIYVLYKLGFFKRSLPYGTAMEKAELKPQAASEA